MHRFGNPLIVKLLDGVGNPVNGALVQFLVSAGGGSVSASNVNTDANRLGASQLDKHRAQ